MVSSVSSSTDALTQIFACSAVGNAAFYNDKLHEELRRSISPLTKLLLYAEEDVTKANAAAASSSLIGHSDKLCDDIISNGVIQNSSWRSQQSSSPMDEQEQSPSDVKEDHVSIPNDGTDVWEIDPRYLKFENKVAAGSYGDLYKGTYCSQEVAIKVLKPERLNTDLQKEFAQEVYIMRFFSKVLFFVLNV